MIRVTNVVYYTEGHNVTGLNLPTSFTVPNSTIRGLTHLPTIGDRITKAIEGDWLVWSFDYQRATDAEPTHYRDEWIASPQHLKHRAETAAFIAAHPIITPAI